MRLTKVLYTIIFLTLFGVVTYVATGTPSTLVVRTDANNSLVVTAVTQVNPVTSGVFSSRVLRTDASGNLQVVLSGTVTPTYPLSIPASTCVAPSLGLSGGATTGIAFTATPSILHCISGVAKKTLTATTDFYDNTIVFFGWSDTRIQRAAVGRYLFTDGVTEWLDLNTTLLTMRGRFSLISSTFTTDLNQINGTVTWNNAGVTFTGWKLNVTNTNSSGSSLLMDLQVGAVSLFSVRRDGAVNASQYTGSYFISPNGTLITDVANGSTRITNAAATFGLELNSGASAAPTVSSCGTGAITAGSRNTTGEFTATGATACTVTFSTAFSNTPFCVIALRNAPTTTPYISAISSTAFTVSGLTANDVVAYHCIGRI